MRPHWSSDLGTSKPLRAQPHKIKAPIATLRLILAHRHETPSKIGAFQMENHDDATNDKNFSGPKHSPNDSPGEVSESGAKQKPKPPISERKLVANRLNARRSTGPKTPEGKQRSAQNSFKSGIFVRQLFLNTDSGRKEWQAYEDVATG